MAQNIYDQPDFFDAYSRLERSVHGLEGAPEWPVLRTRIPDLTGRRVVDLGCGFGWFCRWARTAGAASVLGLDLSRRMLDRAAAMTDDAAIRYQRADLETLTLPAAAFDLAYSALALHYIADLDRLIGVIRRGLTDGGTFVFSAEHPLLTAPVRPEWVTMADGRRVWPLDRYLEEGPRRVDWLTPGVGKYHRTIGTMVKTLIDNDFTITFLEEYGPSPAQVAARPEWAEFRDRPIFILMAATAGAGGGGPNHAAR